ncbi:importin-alpha export receptor [Malassezia brasiliensis]|uniref:Importin-alpha export receptor n=1 Tax=Malassezia brasiliensis TaxID=1821822 RepID=A0AAF0IQ58_9BASI|nr:importin-alpha export receptor [Malassezia brasiliensis]
MDPSDPQQLSSLASLFQQTLNPAQRKEAEAQLAQLEVQPRFAFLLLALIQNEAVSTAIRLAAAIQFKNLCKTRWVLDSEEEDASRIVSDDEKQVIRAQLVPEVVRLAQAATPSQAILAQMNESIALVAQSDFPEPWGGLIDELVRELGSDNYYVLLSVLSTSHAIFRRWRSMFRSDALYTEINLVLSKFAVPLLELMHRVYTQLTDASTPAATAAPLASCLVLLLQLFYDLSAQDLPPQFEDAIPTLSPMFTSLLKFSRPELVGDEEDMAPSLLDKIRSSVCEIFELYAKRYLDVLPQLPEYVQAVWDMLATYGKAEKYDVIVSKAILFLAVVVRMGNQRSVFEADATLEQFVSAIVLPNIELRDIDEEIFEDNPMEYIRRDLEASVEVDTRRRAASEFVRSLLEQFSAQVTAICSRHIRAYLDAFQADMLGAWKKKDAAIYLLTSIAAQGATAQHGVSSTNTLVDVVQFFSEHVLQDLEPGHAVAARRPILQVDAIKFLYTFRNQLTKEQLLSVVPYLVRLLASDNYVTCTYAAITIERILFIKVEQRFVFTAEDVAPFRDDMLRALFAAIVRNETPEKMAENDHLMKCVMRVLLTARQTLAPSVAAVVGPLEQVLRVTSRNPSNPRFTQFLFESIAAVVRYAGVHLDEVEQHFFGPFTEILQTDAVEYVPYVFQVLAQLLEQRAARGADAALPETYAALLPPLLTPALWEQKGNVPALVRLLTAYLRLAPARIVEGNHVEAFLGIYQKLISSRVNDVYGFALLQALLRHLPASVVAPYFQPILTLMLLRLQSSKTERFSQHFCVFVGVFCGVQQPGYPEQVVEAFERVQPGLFAQILQNVVVPDLGKLAEKQRFHVAAGLIRLLCEAPSMLGAQAAVWPVVLGGVLGMLSSAAQPPADDADDEQHVAELDEQGFQATFSQLAASMPTRAVAEADTSAAAYAGTDLAAYLVRELRAAAEQRPGEVPRLVAQLAPAPRAVLDETLRAAQVVLP